LINWQLFIRLLIILFVFTENETVEDANDNDGIDIDYHHWQDDKITISVTRMMKIKKTIKNLL
jgi:hypothetical protein